MIPAFCYRTHWWHGIGQEQRFFCFAMGLAFAICFLRQVYNRGFCWPGLSFKDRRRSIDSGNSNENTLHKRRWLFMTWFNYKSLPTIPIIPTPIFKISQHCFAIMNNGTGGSFALVKCNCNNRLTMLMKLAMEKTEIDKEVSLRIASRGCVRWYKKVKVYLSISLSKSKEPRFYSH